MTFEEGVYVNDISTILSNGIRPSDVARLVTEVFCEQVGVCQMHFRF